VADLALMLVTDRRLLAEGSVGRLAAEAARAGVDLIQVREKDLGDRALLRLAAEVCEAVQGTTARVLVNGRPDVAAAAGAHGVQLPEAGLPAGAVRRGFPRLVIGVSCHSAEAVAAAGRAGADFALLGPIFTTPGKDRPLGLDVLAAAAGAGLPVYAIGGIDAAVAGDTVRAGARGVAAIRAFLEPPVADAVRALRRGMGAARA
jgi:thiamine-phosphate pyrophosphorylase